MSRRDQTVQRLDRRIAHATGLSRSQVQRAIRAAQVTVDGVTVTDPGAPVTAGVPVIFAGRPLAGATRRYYMLHKPAGVVCATRDRTHRTVLDLLAVPNPAGLHVAGRLDLDATGLVLITDDGEWSHRITSPRHKLPKTYRLTLAEPLVPAAVMNLQAGILLHGETRRCAPAVLERLSDTDIRLTISEGKYHQVKRMIAAVGSHVIRLHRERIGPWVLDPALGPGEFRALTDDEIGRITVVSPGKT
jgi:16S rRNA pseudouridine516 synthase